jgi:hypothetical protein
VIRVDGRTLRCADVVTAAATVGPLPIDVSTAAPRAAEHAWKLAEELTAPAGLSIGGRQESAPTRTTRSTRSTTGTRSRTACGCRAATPAAAATRCPPGRSAR